MNPGPHGMGQMGIPFAASSIVRDLFGITKNRLASLKKEIVIMHPGPINRGVEIDTDVADSDQSIILNQVLNGVAVRMSILYLLLGRDDVQHKELFGAFNCQYNKIVSGEIFLEISNIFLNSWSFKLKFFPFN